MRMNHPSGIFGISSLLFRELPLEKALGLLARTGLKWIDLTVVPGYCPHYDFDKTTLTDDKGIAKMIDSYGFKVSSLNIFPGYYNIHDPQEIDKRILRAAQLAKELNTRIITIPSGARVETDKWTDTVKNVAVHLREIAYILYSQYGVILSVETPHLRTLTETLEESIRFHEILNSETIKCTIDTSHVTAQGFNDLPDILSKIGIEKINHIHLRDAHRQDISYTPGKGDANFSGFFNKLRNSDYSGKLIFELEYHDYPIEKKLAELNFALNFCENLYLKGKLSVAQKIKTQPLYLLLEGLIFNPVAEIKRHQKFFMFIRNYKKLIFGLMPEKVFEGHWVNRYRFNKNKFVVQTPGYVKIDSASGILKIGIIGLGYAGAKMHAGGYERLDNCKIVGGVDIDEKKRDQFAKRYNCTAYSRLEDMISQERPDIVSICTREWLHYEATMYCLKNGIDVFCEKLMATRIDHAKAMVKVADENSKVLAVNYNYRFIPAIQKIKEVIDYQALGKLSFFVINVHAFSYAHAIDLLSFFGGKIKSVSAYNHNDPSKRVFAGTDWSFYDTDIQYIPSIATNVMVEFENGATGVINSSIHYPLHSFIMSIEAVFEEGILNFSGMNMFNIKGKLSWYSKKQITAVDLNYTKNMYAKGYELSFYNSIESFIKNYVAGKKPETDGLQGLFNMELEKQIHKTSLNQFQTRYSQWI